MIKKVINKYLPQLFLEITNFGGLIFYILILGFVFLSWNFLLFWQLLFGLVINITVVVVIRLLYFKNRPNKQEFTNIIERIDASSFPSLHTARIFFLALIFLTYFQNIYLGIFLMTMACLVAYSRYYLRKHDTYDLFGGLVLGVLVFYISTLIF